MQDLSKISTYDAYFFVQEAAKAIVKRQALLDPFCAPVLGTGWAATVKPDAAALRSAVESLIRENVETTGALSTAEGLARNVSQWRELATSVARNAPKERRELLLRAAGYGLGTPRSVKEMKDLLLQLQERAKVHAEEFTKLGLSPALLGLPERVLKKLEAGAAEVAREKAEDDRARADVASAIARVRQTYAVAWRGADLVAAQARLLAENDLMSAEETSVLIAQAEEAEALGMELDRILDEARVQSRKSADEESLPPGLADAPGDEPSPAEQPAA